MFPADSLAGIHYEESKLADARRLAELRTQQEKAALQSAQILSIASRQNSLVPPAQPSSVRQGLLSGIFQGLVRSASGASTPALTHLNSSRTSTPMVTPMQTPDKTPTAAEIEAALFAEKRRDADICSMPTWYH